MVAGCLNVNGTWRASAFSADCLPCLLLGQEQLLVELSFDRPRDAVSLRGSSRHEQALAVPVLAVEFALNFGYSKVCGGLPLFVSRLVTRSRMRGRCHGGELAFDTAPALSYTIVAGV